MRYRPPTKICKFADLHCVVVGGTCSSCSQLILLWLARARCTFLTYPHFGVQVNKATAAASEKAKEVADKVSEAGSNMVEGSVEQMKEFTKKVGGGGASARDT